MAAWLRFSLIQLLLSALVGTSSIAAEFRTVVPPEDTNAVLANPDMGWVLYENYPIDRDPNGSSTLLTLPEEPFREVSEVAIMFSWQDIETKPDHYDFSHVDHAYDYWRKLGKRIQLRISAESLLWWENRTPPAGKGVPGYVLEKLSPDEKQERKLENQTYTVVDARNSYYQERLKLFLEKVAAHFSDERPVTLVDLRGFGVWGEWHSGFKYKSDEERREALKQIIDTWAQAFPNHRLALSYSYDPDGPGELYSGPTDTFSPKDTRKYDEFLQYSAFDYAFTKTNITFRRDGAGGAVHSNERKFNEEVFAAGRGPLFCEFLGGYAQNKKGGKNWLNWMLEDALSLHPNYICLMGWQGADALTFTKEKPELIALGANSMGYRFVPVSLTYPTELAKNEPIEVEITWVNRGVGRALRDYKLQWRFVPESGPATDVKLETVLPTTTWIKGKDYVTFHIISSETLDRGKYALEFALFDPGTESFIALPITSKSGEVWYKAGDLEIKEPKKD